MTLLAGIGPAVGEAPSDVEHPDRMWSRRKTADLLPGMRFVYDDGLSLLVLVVAARPRLARLGRLAVPVWTPEQQPYADELPVEDAVPVWIPARRLLKTRTPAEQAAYLRAVETWAADAALTEGAGK